MHIKRIFLVFIAVIFLLITSYLYHNKVFYIHFVDEEESMVIGSYLLKGEKLYSDLFSQHGPVTYILSSAIQKLFSPNSIFLLIKRHREFMIAWSFCWSVFLVFRFGRPFLFFSFVYEVMKIFLLGNLFLAESLVVYPVVYLSSLMVLKIKRVKVFEAFFIGLVFSFCFLTLASIWPLLFLLMIIIYSRFFKNGKKRTFAFVGATLVFLVVFTFIPIKEYFIDTILINFKYYIPSGETASSLNLIRSFFAFIDSFFPKIETTSSLVVIRLLSVLFLINAFALVLKRKLGLVLLMLILLGLINLRFVDPGQEYYRGFHLLPWFSLLILFGIIGNNIVLGLFKSTLLKGIFIFSLLVVIMLSFKFSYSELFITRDLSWDYYVNYSRQFDFGQAVKIMKDPNESLFVAPDECLVYWQADTDHSLKYIFFYSWMMKTKLLFSEVEEMFNQNPPTFFYCNCKNTQIEKYTKFYSPIYKNGSATDLYVLPEKVESLDKNKLGELKYYEFEFK